MSTTAVSKLVKIAFSSASSSRCAAELLPSLCFKAASQASRFHPERVRESERECSRERETVIDDDNRALLYYSRKPFSSDNILAEEISSSSSVSKSLAAAIS